MFSTSLITLALCLGTLTQYNIIRQNPLAAVSDMLVVNTADGDHGETVSLSCGDNTKISILSVYYGDDGCSVEGAIGVVERLCQGEVQCDIVVATIEDMVCHSKPLLVRYQCRPGSFRSRTMCRGDTDNITCQNNQQGLVILSANFVSINSNYFFCPSISSAGIQSSPIFSRAETEHMESCQEASVTPVLKSVCGGKQSCRIKADPVLLESLQCEDLGVFLKVTYACVSKDNLLDTVNYNSNNTGEHNVKKEDKQSKEEVATDNISDGILLSHIRVIYTKQNATGTTEIDDKAPLIDKELKQNENNSESRMNGDLDGDNSDKYTTNQLSTQVPLIQQTITNNNNNARNKHGNTKNQHTRTSKQTGISEHRGKSEHRGYSEHRGKSEHRGYSEHSGTSQHTETLEQTETSAPLSRMIISTTSFLPDDLLEVSV